MLSTASTAYSLTQSLGMTWASNTDVCSACPPSAALDLSRLTCECDAYHYGPGCTLCRPEWDANTCDGSLCAPGYVAGVPPGVIDPSLPPLPSYACSVCDVGYCRSSLAGANGALCALCSSCGANGFMDATLGICFCNAHFRGPTCDECLPQFTGAGCTACAPGYVDANAGECDACDTGAGFCSGVLGLPNYASTSGELIPSACSAAC